MLLTEKDIQREHPGAGGGKRAYSYRYDEVSRLQAARYGTFPGSVWNATMNHYAENLTYDLNGNIQSLQRGTQTGSLSTNSYQYLSGGNRLGSINSGGLFTYDLNGNMTKHGHKGFVVEYNHLNLPRKVSLGTGNISYIYSASGQKLAKRQASGTMRYYAGNTEYQGTTPFGLRG